MWCRAGFQRTSQMEAGLPLYGPERWPAFLAFESSGPSTGSRYISAYLPTTRAEYWGYGGGGGATWRQ